MTAVATLVASPFNWLGLFIGAALFVVMFPRRDLRAIGWLLAFFANIPVLITLSKQEHDPVGLVDFLSMLGVGGFGLGAIVG